MSLGHDFNPFMPPFVAKREIRVRETELIHTLHKRRVWRNSHFLVGTLVLVPIRCAKLRASAGLASFACVLALFPSYVTAD
jgi:hypothetical protein